MHGGCALSDHGLLVPAVSHTRTFSFATHKLNASRIYPDTLFLLHIVRLRRNIRLLRLMRPLKTKRSFPH